MELTEARNRVSEILALLRDASVPDGLQPTVFTLLWESTIGPAVPKALDRSRAGVVSTTGSTMATLAARIGVEEEHLADIFSEEEDGSLAVRVAARQISPRKATGTIELGLLACAGKQSNAQVPTPGKVIRELCNSYGRLDGANFAGTMRSGDRYWQVIGKGADAAFLLRRPGWDAATDLIRRLGGAD